MKIKNVLLILCIFVLVIGLGGCNKSEVYKYTFNKTSTINIDDEDDKTVDIPIEKILILEKDGDYCPGMSYEIITSFTADYFKNNEDKKNEYIKNYEQDYKEGFKDDNEDAMTVETQIKGDNNDVLDVTINVTFAKLSDFENKIEIFGLTTDYFDEEKKVEFSKVEKFYLDSGYTKVE
jgi:hypothetical protein